MWFGRAYLYIYDYMGKIYISNLFKLVGEVGGENCYIAAEWNPKELRNNSQSARESSLLN